MTSSRDEIIRIHDPEIDVAQLMLQIRENMQSRSELPPLPHTQGISALVEERRAVYRAVSATMEKIQQYGRVDILREGVKGRLENLIKQTIRKTIQRHINQQDDVHLTLMTLINRLVQYIEAQGLQIDASLSRLPRYAENITVADWFPAELPILDLACGRGDIVAALCGEGRNASGIDTDPVALAWADDRGLSVSEAEPAKHLAELPADSLGGIYLPSAYDALDPEQLSTLLGACFTALASGGALVAISSHAGDMERVLTRTGFADVQCSPSPLVVRGRKP